MSLQGLNPKETVTAYQLLMELAGGLAQLNKDPKALEKAIFDAYKLTEQEQAKVEKARAEISKYEAVVKEQKQTLDDISKQISALDSKKEELGNLQSNLDKIRESLSTQEKKLNDYKLDLASQEKSLKEEKTKLDAEKSKNEKTALQLKDFENILNEREESLKSKEEQLKAIIGGK